MIKNDYRAQWIIDNLPAGVLRSFIGNGINDSKIAYYENGFPIGFKIEDEYYINNHINLIIKVHTKD
jgi:hypothetical protein